MTDDDAFIHALVEEVGADPDVLGLVLCGSSAETGRRDQWSDHDFLLITADGTPESYRTDLGWLPESDAIAFSFRETAHGLKVLYRSGLMLEFAAFDRAEFASCALNHYSVAMDRGGIADVARDVRARSLTPRTVDRVAEFRNFLSLIYLGTGRARRGELLSANVMIRTYATEHLLRLVRDLLPADRLTSLDALDPWRRFESADPEFAAAVDSAVARPCEDCARALVDLAASTMPVRWPEYPVEDLEVVRALLSW